MIEFISLNHMARYSQQQNKWHRPKKCSLAHFEATFDFIILAVANLIAYNNFRLCYYVQVNSLRLK